MRWLNCIVLLVCTGCGAESANDPPIEIGGAGGAIADMTGGAGGGTADMGAGGMGGGAGGMGGGSTGHRLTAASLRVAGGRPVDADHDLVGGASLGATVSTNARGRLIAVINP